MLPFSLRKRLLISALIVLICFLGITGISLDRAYQDSAIVSYRETLTGYLHALLAVSDVDPSGRLTVKTEDMEPRFSFPASGIYASILSTKQESRLWSSSSSIGVELPEIPILNTGILKFSKEKTSSGGFFIISFGIAWQVNNGFNQYVFSIAEDLERYHKEIATYRKTLWFWLSTLAVFLLIVQGLVVQWGLRPLRKVAEEIREVEDGEKDSLVGEYPRELFHLTSSINDLIKNERNHLIRYRNTLGDLAHSLKTPLAVLQGYFEHKPNDNDLNKTAFEQVWRMQEIVDYQLQRAAVSGKRTFNKPLQIKPVITKIINALDKVYLEKQLSAEINVGDETSFYGEKGDLMEILGNLLENAYKWANSRVVINAHAENIDHQMRPVLLIIVEDDGSGISDSVTNRVTQRGVRGDEIGGPSGQGIGLSVVKDIVDSYSGELIFSRSNLGGCKVSIRF